MEIINIIAIVLSPVIAVLITQFLQNKILKRKDKIEIFKILVSRNAIGWGRDYNVVNALNSIPVIFADKKAVVEQYTKYVSSCKSSNETMTDIEIKGMETQKVKLLEVMAKSLKYKSEWQVFTETYLPRGIADDINNQIKNQEANINIGNLAKIALEGITENKSSNTKK